jgi:hypothetical protein
MLGASNLALAAILLLFLATETLVMIAIPTTIAASLLLASMLGRPAPLQ